MKPLIPAEQVWRRGLGLGCFLLVVAQAPGQSPALGATANSAWASLATAQQSAGPNATPAQQVTQLIQAAAAAHAFYTAYPSDSRAPAAQKIEVLSTLEAAGLDPAAYQASAVALATAFRNNTSLAVDDRIDVAFACDRMLLPLGGKPLEDNGPAYVKLVDNLYAEFGPQDRIFNLYIGAMESVDETTALAVANELVALNAPAFALTPAQAVIARSNLVGKPVNLSPFVYNSGPLNVAVPVGEPTILYFWSNANGLSQLPLLGQYTASTPAGVRVIYICLQANMSAVAQAEAQAPLPGIFCFQASGLNTNEETTLGLLCLPYAYVLDSRGNLSGYGRPEDLPALLGALRQ